jgi:hypothetical protein
VTESESSSGLSLRAKQEIILAAKEAFSTLCAVVFMLGLRIGEGLALRESDLDFERKIIRARQSVDSATRKAETCKSRTSSADLPTPPSPAVVQKQMRHSDAMRPRFETK